MTTNIKGPCFPLGFFLYNLHTASGAKMKQAVADVWNKTWNSGRKWVLEEKNSTVCHDRWESRAAAGVVIALNTECFWDSTVLQLPSSRGPAFGTQGAGRKLLRQRVRFGSGLHSWALQSWDLQPRGRWQQAGSNAWLAKWKIERYSFSLTFTRNIW